MEKVIDKVCSMAFFTEFCFPVQGLVKVLREFVKKPAETVL